MKAWKQPSEYYLRYKETPVKQYPYDPETGMVAGKVILQLKEIVGEDLEIIHMGSSALKIAGKNDVEVYIFSKNWNEDAEKLTKKYGKPGHVEDEFIRFNHVVDNLEVEIIMVRGYVGKLNKAVHKYFLEHPEAGREYEKIKLKYAHSRREYQRHKDKFFEKIVESLPEDYVSD